METPSSDSRPVSSPNPAYALKGEAKQLRDEARANGQELTQGAALERVAHRRGFRDWNALNAHLAQADSTEAAVPTTFPWARLDEPLPQLPMRIVQPSELRRHGSITELMRWARQLDLIAERVAEPDRKELLQTIGDRTPYVLEQSLSRWPDGLFHLCDRGYEVFKGIAFSEDQVTTLGLREWNDAFGQHSGNDSVTVIGDEWRYTRNGQMLKRMARLLASLAVEADRAGDSSTR